MTDVIKILEIIVTCFAFVALITPIIRKLALHVNAHKEAGERDMHHGIVPRLGGLAVYCGFLLGYMIFYRETLEMNSILIGSFVVLLVGVIDDIKPIPNKVKFLGQILGALVVACYGNILLSEIQAFGFELNFGVLAYPITVLFIVSIINCINFIDGLDGLASGTSCIYFFTIGVIALMQNMMGGLDSTLAFIMVGSTLGFLVHNFYPAKIFLGDSGSHFLGFIIAVIALLGFKNVTLTSLIVPIVILAIPILDTLLAILRRIIKGEPIDQADKLHFHHQLLNMNLSHPMTVIIIYIINILFSLVSIFYVLRDQFLGQVLYIALVLFVIWFICSTTILFDKKKKLK